MKFGFIQLIFVFISFMNIQAQTVTPNICPPLSQGTPIEEGMSPQRLALIDKMIDESVTNGEIPGAVALIARNGKIIYHKAFGMANTQRKRLMGKDAIFRIASQTKAITSTAVMILWEEGHFRLDDPISKFIPEFKNPQVLKGFRYSDTTYSTVPANKEITIRHLLTHTSGLGYGMIDNDERMKMIYQKAGIIDAFTTKDITIEENIKKLAALPLHHNPGEKYTYSEGLDVLGYFVEIISGMPFDEFLRERLFKPLDMNDTWFYLPENKAGRLVAVQSYDGGTWKEYDGDLFDPNYPVKGAKTFFSGGAGLSSTAEDYAKFLQMYLNNGVYRNKRILSRTTIKTIMSNQIGSLRGTDKEYYGLAFGVFTEEGVAAGGLGSKGTFDWGGYFNTQYFADPKENIIGIIMKQTRGGPGDPTGWKFRQLVGAAVDD